MTAATSVPTLKVMGWVLKVYFSGILLLLERATLKTKRWSRNDVGGLHHTHRITPDAYGESASHDCDHAIVVFIDLYSPSFSLADFGFSFFSFALKCFDLTLSAVLEVWLVSVRSRGRDLAKGESLNSQKNPNYAQLLFVMTLKNNDPERIRGSLITFKHLWLWSR